MKFSALIPFLLISFFSSAQTHSHTGDRPFYFPNVPGYLTLKTDFHIHSVFSDGKVWPTIRVQEALRDSLDAISLTEHIEYQPHKADIPHPDRNRAYELALAEAKNHDLIIVHGSEITRGAPVGHSNAIFLKNSNDLLQDKAEEAFAQAKQQGAFVFWNHPAWHAQSPKGTPILSGFQKERIQDNELHGVEVINTTDYSKETFQLALDENLTIMGTSDIHGLIEWDYEDKGKQRPITLVFAKQRSVQGLKDALFAGRTVAVYNDLFIGKEEFLAPLLKSSIDVKSNGYLQNKEILSVNIKNNCSSELILENAMPYTFYSSSPVFTLQPDETKTLLIKTLEQRSEIKLQLRTLGAYTQPDVHPVIEWELQVD